MLQCRQSGLRLLCLLYRSQLDLETSDFAPSSPFRALPNGKHQASNHSAVPPQSTPFGRKQPGGTPSPSKKSTTSPSKANYFSPAKSKLRNGIVNPTFVGEAKLKRKREDELIGFRAIGDHGRTTLQRMLDVQRKPRTKDKPVQQTLAPTSPVAAPKERRDDVLNNQAKKRLRRESSSLSDLLGTSSEDEASHINMPMHVLLSSAEANTQDTEPMSLPPVLFGEVTSANTTVPTACPVDVTSQSALNDGDRKSVV